MKTSFFAALRLALVFGMPISIFAQGPLTPPGAPAPTMKSLDQIEARTPISSLPLIIIGGGGYYLTKNLNIASGNAITIAASGVTLDLNGFEITSTEPSPAHSGILINGGLSNIRIMNGAIRGNVTLSGSTFSGSGFANGIQTTGTAPVNAHVLDVSVAGCLSNGINLGASGLVEACTVSVIGGTGITADNVIHSNAYNFGSVGIQAGASATGCYVTSSASPFYGISAEDLVIGCVASCNASSSQGAIETQVARDCWASANSGAGDGLLANIAENCNGASFGTGSGIHCFNSAINCQGFSSAGASGVNVTGTAMNCYGSAFGNGNGVSASGTAQNCYGVAFGDGIGISTTSAINSYGESHGTGTALAANIEENSYGIADASGKGITCGNAANCEALAQNGDALTASVATNCQGFSKSGLGLNAPTIAIGCLGSSNSGTGLSAYIANSSSGETVSGITESVTHKYNMP